MYSLGVMVYLVVVDELLQLVSVHHDVEATHLGQAELLPIHTGKAHLWRERGKQGSESTSEK